MNNKIVYLMRGLPSCGKSFTARRLTGSSGIVLETDQYFYSQVGDDPGSYDYSDDLLETARQWNLSRFRDAIAHGVSPIIFDRGNGLNRETRQYIILAYEHGYQVELRVLLKFKDHVAPKPLDRCAETLAARSSETHRVHRRNRPKMDEDVAI